MPQPVGREVFPYWLKRGSAATRGPRWGPALRALRALRAPHRTPRHQQREQRPGPVPGRCSRAFAHRHLLRWGRQGPAQCPAAASSSPHHQARSKPQTRAITSRTRIAAGHHFGTPSSGHCADPRGRGSPIRRFQVGTSNLSGRRLKGSPGVKRGTKRWTLACTTGTSPPHQALS
jgi:hypothetical protein